MFFELLVFVIATTLSLIYAGFAITRLKPWYAKLISGVFFVLLIPLTIVGYLVFIPHAYNEFIEYRFARRFYSYPLPPETSEISRESWHGFEGRTGNVCSFKAYRVLKTNLSQEEFEAYYAGVGFPTAHKTGSGYALLQREGIDGIGVDIEFHDPHTVTISLSDGFYIYGFGLWDLACYSP
jgi:hypothetical protein